MGRKKFVSIVSSCQQLLKDSKKPVFTQNPVLQHARNVTRTRDLTACRGIAFQELQLHCRCIAPSRVPTNLGINVETLRPSTSLSPLP